MILYIVVQMGVHLILTVKSFFAADGVESAEYAHFGLR